MAIQTYSQIETTPSGLTNASGVINANWQQLELIFNPTGSDHEYDGSSDDMGNTVRNAVLRDEALALTDDGAVEIDFDAQPIQTLDLTQNTTFTFANLGIGKFVILKLTEDSTGYTNTWPGTVTFCTSGSGTITSGKTVLVKLWVVGASDVLGEYHESP